MQQVLDGPGDRVAGLTVRHSLADSPWLGHDPGEIGKGTFMKLVRFGDKGNEKPGLLDADGAIRDASSVTADYAGDALSLVSLAALSKIDPASLPRAPDGVRIGPCVADPGHFIAVGLNFTDHAEETGNPIPDEPVVFSKAPSCLSGPNDDVVLPPGSVKTDWEVELAFVVGKSGYRIAKQDALSHVAAYCICNDVSERAWQNEGTGQWIKGKSAPTFGPVGPWLVTPDEVGDIDDLAMFLDVNGERMQTGSTSTFIFDIATLVSFISHRFEIRTGDLVTTGTPPGVGLGMKPPRFLKAGDEMHLGIAGLGEQRQKVTGG